jgi:periplasmic protein TonB
MFDLVGPPPEASVSRSVRWARFGLLAFVVFAIGGLVAVVMARHRARSAPVAATNAQATPSLTPSPAKAGTEVEIGTEARFRGWRLVLDNTHDVKDGDNAGIAPDQRDAVIFPGGELALAYGDGESIVDRSGSELSVYGTVGDNTPYTMFVRADAADRWIRLDTNRKGFPQGVASHDVRQQRVGQIKIRNDGTTSLFVDAIAVGSPPERAPTDRAATARPALGAQPASVPGQGPATRTPVPPPSQAPVAKPAETVTIDPYRAPLRPSPVQADLVAPNTGVTAPVDSKPEPRVDQPPSASQALAPVETPTDRAAAGRAGLQPQGPLTHPERIRRVPAKYPKVAEMANVEGTVVIEAVIDVDGRVTRPRLLKSIPLLDAAALDAVKQWEFKPAMRDGRPVPVTVKLSVEFVLP